MERRRLALPRKTKRFDLRAPDPLDAAAVQEAIDSLHPWMPRALRLPSLQDTRDFLERAQADFLAGDDFGSGDVPFVPTGVWAEDGSAFFINAPMESDDAAGVLNFTITRVPANGSPAQPIAAVISGNPFSAVFSPDGTQLAYTSVDPERLGPTVLPLTESPGPLAVSHRFHFDYVNVHWAPSGDAYVAQEDTLSRLCPAATSGSQTCGDPVPLGGIMEPVQWLEASRLVYARRAAQTYVTDGLFLGSLGGDPRLVVRWSEDDVFHSYAAVLIPYPGEAP